MHIFRNADMFELAFHPFPLSDIAGLECGWEK